MIKRIISKVSKKSSPEAQLKKDQEQVASQVERAQYIISILKAIDFSGSALPDEELQRKSSAEQSKNDYELTRDYVVARLEDADATQFDTAKIDEAATYAANAFAESIRDGEVNRAKWSMVALLNITNYERTELDETDQDRREQVKEAREKKSQDFVTLLKTCRELDICQKNRAKKESTYQKYVEQFHEMQRQLKEQMDSPEGQLTYEQLNRSYHHPEELSDEAVKLDKFLTQMARRDASIKALRGELRVLVSAINDYSTQMEQLVLALQSEAHVPDPYLQSKIEDIYEQYQHQLAELIVETERMSKNIDTHHAKMLSILNDQSIVERSARNLLYMKQKEEEEQLRARELEAARRRSQEKRQRELERARNQAQESLQEEDAQETEENDQQQYND